jgi:hypothetical protein
MNTHVVSQLAWDRMFSSIEKVRERLKRAVQALEGAGVPYAVAGGKAVAAWVGEVDEAAVRFTQDVDILLRRCDFDRAREALAAAGFHYRHASGIDMFLDGPGARDRDAVHILYAGEKVRPEYNQAAPDVDETRRAGTFSVLKLEPLIMMKLTSFRDKDRTHVRDMIDVGLIDQSWVQRLPAELGARLQHLLDTPEG